MTATMWQTSSFCEVGSSCVGLAATDDGACLIREGDDPDVVITTTRGGLTALIRGIKAGEFDHIRTA